MRLRELQVSYRNVTGALRGPRPQITNARDAAQIVAERVPEIAVDLARIERRKPQTRKLGKSGEHLPDHLSQRWFLRQIGAIGSQIDAGQHDLAIAGGEERARLGDDLVERHRAARPARIGDYAKGAAMVAALLHLQVRPRPKPPLTLPLSP